MLNFHLKFILFALTAPTLCLANNSYLCPSKIHLEAGSVIKEDIPAGFKIYIENSPVWLSGISVFDGPTEQGAALVPTSSNKSGTVSNWIFQGDYPNGKWISCDYANGLIHLSTQVDDKTKSCKGSAIKVGDPKILEARFSCQ